MRPTIRVQADDIAPDREIERLAGSGDVGAIVSFLGLCRSEDGRLAGLELEHYPGMAEEELERVAAEAARRWALMALTVVHRFGLVRPGERIVLVAAAAGHRREAFAAAEFVMDFLKASAPFWKREHLADGTVGPWIDAKDADDEAAARWA